jgi:hypothetical protein
MSGLFMKRSSSPFKWRHYAPDVILLCVRWYCRYSLSYRPQEVAGDAMLSLLPHSGENYRRD